MYPVFIKLLQFDIYIEAYFGSNIYIILQPQAMLSKATISRIESHRESHGVCFVKLQYHKWPQGKVWARPESGKTDPNTAVCAKTMSYLPCFILISKLAESRYDLNANKKDERLKAENSPHYSEFSSLDLRTNQKSNSFN